MWNFERKGLTVFPAPKITETTLGNRLANIFPFRHKEA